VLGGGKYSVQFLDGVDELVLKYVLQFPEEKRTKKLLHKLLICFVTLRICLQHHAVIVFVSASCSCDVHTFACSTTDSEQLYWKCSSAVVVCTSAVKL
jgi:hypothetical protein